MVPDITARLIYAISWWNGASIFPLAPDFRENVAASDFSLAHPTGIGAQGGIPLTRIDSCGSSVHRALITSNTAITVAWLLARIHGIHIVSTMFMGMVACLRGYRSIKVK